MIDAAPATSATSASSTSAPFTDDDSSNSRNCRPRTVYDWCRLEELSPKSPEQWHECHLKLIQQEEAGEVDDEYEEEKEEEIDVLITNATKTMRPSESHLAPIPLEIVYSGSEEEVAEARELIENPDARETALDEVLHQLDHLPESMRTLLEQMIANHNAEDHPLKYCSVEEFHSMVDSHLHPSGGGEYEYVGKLVQQLESALKLSQYELSNYMKTKELDFNEMGPLMIEQKRIKEELIKQRAILFPLESPLWQACINYLKKVRKCLDRDPVSICHGEGYERRFGFLNPTLLSSSLTRDQPSSSEPLLTDAAAAASTSTSSADTVSASSSATAIGLDEMKTAAAELIPSEASNAEQDRLALAESNTMEESDDEDEDEQVHELSQELRDDRWSRYQWMCDQIKEYERIRRGQDESVETTSGRLIWSDVDTFLKETTFIGKEVKQTIQFLFTQPNFMIDPASPVIGWIGWGRMGNDTPLNPALPLDRKLLRALDALIDCIIELTDEELDEYDTRLDEHRALKVSADGLCALVEDVEMHMDPLPHEWTAFLSLKLVEQLRDRIENSTSINAEADRAHHAAIVEFYNHAKEALRFNVPTEDESDGDSDEEGERPFMSIPDHLHRAAYRLELFKAELIIPRRSMEFLIRELAQEWSQCSTPASTPAQGWSPLLDFEPEAIDALHHAAEAFLIDQFDATGVDGGGLWYPNMTRTTYHPEPDRILTTLKRRR